MLSRAYTNDALMFLMPEPIMLFAGLVGENVDYFQLIDLAAEYELTEFFKGDMKLEFTGVFFIVSFDEGKIDDS